METKYSILLLGLMLIAGLAAGYGLRPGCPSCESHYTSSRTAANLSGIAFSTEGLALANASVDASNLYLVEYGGCRALSIATNQYQILSIESGLEGRVDFRPSAHDLLYGVSDTFGIDIIRARVDGIEDGVYVSTLFFGQNATVLTIDSRTTDAVAMAVRAGSPIYVPERLLEEGIRVC